MKIIDFDEEKNKKLKKERGYCFDDIISLLENGDFKILKNTSSNHPNQKMFLVFLNNYPIIIPFVKNKEKIFLKTMFKNRNYKEKK